MSKKALIVGIDDYPECTLKGCVSDATEIASLLERNENGTKNFDVLCEKNIKTKDLLLQRIKELFSQNDDIALLYFSGHGSKNDGNEYICTPDYSHSFPGVKLSDILEIVNNSHCKNKVVILDSCFSGGLGQTPFTGDKAILSKGTTILSACRNNESSIETNGHGLFTYLLIGALKGGAAELLGHITPGAIYAYIDKALSSWNQRPVFKTNVEEFVSFRDVKPAIELSDLKSLSILFPEKSNSINLNPSFEFTNNPQTKHEYIKPYSTKENIDKFKILQRLERVGLVEPVNEEHMYFAAMHSESCRLTTLGMYYKNLSQTNRL